eukprot:753432-Hanusia_phi.AAC.3
MADDQHHDWARSFSRIILPPNLFNMAEQEQGQSGQDSPKKDMDELIHRVAKLERQTSMGPENGSHGQNGAADGHVSKDLSDLFQLDGDGDGKDDNGKTANSKQTGSSLDLCTNLWGGPIQPRSDQSLWYVEDGEHEVVC